MPPDSRKKFEHFLAARRRRLRRGAETSSSVFAHLAEHPAALFDALWPPVFALAFYGVAAGFSVFTPLFPWAHGLALFLWAIWLSAALRRAGGFWPRWAHARFALLAALPVLFGSCWGGPGELPARAWIAPPLYARQPAVPLDASWRARRVEVPSGSVLHLALKEGASKAQARFERKTEEVEGGEDQEGAVSFNVPFVETPLDSGLVLWRGLRRLGLWRLRVMPDHPPRIAFVQDPEPTARKTLRLAFEASDDYGVERVLLRVAPAAQGATTVDAVELELVAPAAKEVHSASYADLTSLPWTGEAVSLQLIAVDGAGHRGYSAVKNVTLPSRAFGNPFARALIEERQKLLGAPDISARDEAANVMAGIARQQGMGGGDPVVVMALRAGAVRLVLGGGDAASLTALRRLLWQTALRLEEGALGLARADLAAAERGLSGALLRQVDDESLTPYLAHLRAALEGYARALQAERARRPPALQPWDWSLDAAGDSAAPEDLEARVTEIAALMKENRRPLALERLDQLQAFIENLRTTPPELTGDQRRMVEQTSALRALVRGQKGLIEDTAQLAATENASSRGEKEKRSQRDAATRLVAQQQLLLAALQGAAGKMDPTMTLEIRGGEKAMQKALDALRKAQFALAQQRQAEALALMENSLLALTEKMRQALGPSSKTE